MANIYTRTGDNGTTGLVGGQRVSKSDLRIELIGAIDELNAALGIAVALLPKHNPVSNPIVAVLVKLQSELFAFGAQAGTPHDSAYAQDYITDDHVVQLEQQIDQMQSSLPALRNFILPGGTAAAAHIHLARTICRRAERIFVGWTPENEAYATLGRYLNRLSDFLFVMARYINHRELEETIWSWGQS